MTGEIYIEKSYYDDKQFWYKLETIPFDDCSEYVAIWEAIQKARRLNRQTGRHHRVSKKTFEQTKRGGAFVIWGPVYFRHFYLIQKKNRPYINLFPYEGRLTYGNA